MESKQVGLPDPTSEVLPGVVWGLPEWIPSAAFWRQTALRMEPDRNLFSRASSLQNETVFCLLGGHGVTAELNCATFNHLLKSGVLDQSPAVAADIEEVLRQPLNLGDRRIRYRFPQQRATRIADALMRLREDTEGLTCPQALRSHLMTIKGIGPKTASWIVRNCLDADDVAILDIHVHRAGLLIGLFKPSDRLPRDYSAMEAQFLRFANAIGVRPSLLDAVMWSTMRTLGVPREEPTRREVRGKRRRKEQRRYNNEAPAGLQAAG